MLDPSALPVILAAPSELKLCSLDGVVEFIDMLELCVSLDTGVTALLLFVLDSRCGEVAWL